MLGHARGVTERRDRRSTLTSAPIGASTGRRLSSAVAQLHAAGVALATADAAGHPAGADGVGEAVGDDRADDRDRGDVEDQARRAPTSRLEHEEGEEHRGDALRPEPGHEQLLRARACRCARRRASTATGRATSRAKTTKSDQRRDAVVEAGGDDQGAEDEEGDHLEDRAGVLGELDEALGDVALGRAHRDPADEGGDQPVADRHVGEAEGDEGEADRVDPLVAGGEAAAGQAVVEPAAERAERRRRSRRRTAASPTSFAASVPASPPGAARTRKKRTKGSARPSLRPDSRLSVWRTDAGHQPRGDDGRGDDGVGRREHGAEQERLGPARARGRAPSPPAPAAPS